MPSRIVFLLASVAVACQTPRSTVSSARLSDGKQWTTENLRVQTAGSTCYDGANLNCQKYGRLYPWADAKQGCSSLGAGWRLPTDDEWRQLSLHYGGVREDSQDGGQGAYTALMSGGSSGLNALLGGGLVPGEPSYARLEEHGFYWSATENQSGAWFYNFGKGGGSLNRHREGNKRMAISVRCVKE
jgi:uncharacterized protein (TIGR02145 family)